jgi:hypothetical protein
LGSSSISKLILGAAGKRPGSHLEPLEGAEHDIARYRPVIDLVRRLAPVARHLLARLVQRPNPARRFISMMHTWGQCRSMNPADDVKSSSLAPTAPRSVP